MTDAKRGHEFSFSRGQARASWPEQGIVMKFDLLRLERRTGELSAEVTVAGQSNGHAGLLHRARLNLGSTRSRAEFATHLSRRWSGPEWPDLVEAAAWQVIEHSRRGREAFLLRDAVEPPAVGWALEPILLARDPVILFGDGGDGKSYLSLAFGVALQSGLSLTSGLEPTRVFRVAYCDWEWNEWPHKRRLRALCGRGELPEIVYVPCGAEGPLTNQVERLQRVFQEHRIEFAILDSVALACDGPPEEAVSATAFFQALARLEVGSLLIAHTSKDSDKLKPFGSSYWHNSARSTWFVRKLRTLGTTGVDLGLYQRKANDGAIRARPIALHFEFNVTGTTSITNVDLDSVTHAQDEGAALRDRLINARRLAGMPMTYAQLAAALADGTNANTVGVIVRRFPETFEVINDVGPSRAKLVNLRGKQASVADEANNQDKQHGEQAAAIGARNGQI